MNADITQTFKLLERAHVDIGMAQIEAWPPSQRMDARTWALLEIDAQIRGEPGYIWPDFLLKALKATTIAEIR